MPDPLERLSGLAPRIEHAAARRLFDRRRRRRRRRQVTLSAALAGVVLAGVMVVFAVVSNGDAARVSTSDDGSPATTADDGVSPPVLSGPGQGPEPAVWVVNAATDDTLTTVVDALSSCGFAIVGVERTPSSPADTAVAAAEPYADLGATVATIVDVDMATTGTDTSPGGAAGADIVVTLGTSFDTADLNLSPCPVSALLTIGSPRPGAPPLLRLDGTLPDGTIGEVADVYASVTLDAETTPDLCVVFIAGTTNCGWPITTVPAVVGKTLGPGGDFLAVVAPVGASSIEAVTDVGVRSGDAIRIPAGTTVTGTVAVLGIDDVAIVEELVARDAAGAVLARNDADGLLEVNHPRASTVDCGPGLPAGLQAPRASALLEGVAPTDPQPPLHGQRVVHWTSGAARFELRWPPSPQPHYGSAELVSWPSYVAGRTEEGIVIDLTDGGLVSGETDVVFTDSSLPDNPACRVVQIDYWVRGQHTRVGIRLTGEASAPVERVDLGPVVTSRQADRPAPGQVVGCPNHGAAKRSGMASDTTFATSAEALVAFLDTDPVTPPLPRSGWTEFGAGSELVYGWETQPESNQYAALVGVTQHEDGWSVDWWQGSGC